MKDEAHKNFVVSYIRSLLNWIEMLSGADNERCVIIVRQELNARLVIRFVLIMCNPLIYPNLAHYLEGFFFFKMLKHTHGF